MSRLRELAKGQECKVRIEGVCNQNHETTVLAHLNGGGMGMKHLDIFGAHCCSDCHDIVDGRGMSYTSHHETECFYDGMKETQQWLYDNGHLSWNGDEVKRKDAQAMETLGRWLKRNARRLI